MATGTRPLVAYVQSRLRAVASPRKAGPMAAYMKTDMPFYGVQKPEREPIFREMNRRFAPSSRRQYEAAVGALWRLPHREEKYAALEYASSHQRFITSRSLPLYEKVIREGAWWDFVDFAAIALAGHVLLYERRAVRPVINRWIDDENLWIRRTALIAHNRHREKTDQKQLFRHCLRRADEREFFIRKAIGWALRQYSYTAPLAVRDFLVSNQQRLSGLTYREAAKQLVRTGVLKKSASS